MEGAGRLKRRWHPAPALATALLVGGAAPADEAGRCRIDRLQPPAGVEIVAAEALPAGPFVAPDGTRITIPTLCRVRGIARPTPASRIGFELWLPARNWNGRYYQLGNGGFAGNIHLPSLAAEAARGNAAAATDTGHSGTGFDASWAAGRPELVVDYGHRSIKSTSDAARALIAAYYGREPTRRYFAGCSNGGRQALMAAARYPDDWDGIIAGAPANPWTKQLANFAAIQHQLRAVPGGWLPADKLPAIQRRALAACRPAAGVADGVAADPQHCPFDPAAMQCRSAETSDCLTPPQVASVRRLIAAGYHPTGAALPGGWDQWIATAGTALPSQYSFATQAMRHLADRTGWQPEDFRPGDTDALGRLSPLLDARAADLARFRDREGRIISYFGWADALIAPGLGTRFYSEAAAALGGTAATQRFYRLFMIPGMLHCQGGAGATSFGQSLPAPAARADRHHDIRRALEAWVEQGIPPDAIIAASNDAVTTRTITPFEP